MTTPDPKNPAPATAPPLPIAAEVARAKYQRMRKALEAVKAPQPKAATAPEDPRVRAFLTS